MDAKKMDFPSASSGITPELLKSAGAGFGFQQKDLVWSQPELHSREELISALSPLVGKTVKIEEIGINPTVGTKGVKGRSYENLAQVVNLGQLELPGLSGNIHLLNIQKTIGQDEAEPAARVLLSNDKIPQIHQVFDKDGQTLRGICIIDTIPNTEGQQNVTFLKVEKTFDQKWQAAESLLRQAQITDGSISAIKKYAEALQIYEETVLSSNEVQSGEIEMTQAALLPKNPSKYGNVSMSRAWTATQLLDEWLQEGSGGWQSYVKSDASGDYLSREVFGELRESVANSKDFNLLSPGDIFKIEQAAGKKIIGS